jgi:hypothetical protein
MAVAVPLGIRVCLLLALLSSSGEAVRRLTAPHLSPAVAAGRMTLPEVVLAGSSLSLALCWLWLATVSLVLAADVVRRGTRTASRLRMPCPRVVRVAVLTLLGAGISALPAHGEPTTPDHLAGLALPDRPVTERLVDDPPPTSQTLRVTRGDTLWSLAAGLLPAGASQQDVDRLWRAIAAANRDRLPDGPHLIFPGTTLRVPHPVRPLGKERP